MHDYVVFMPSSYNRSVAHYVGRAINAAAAVRKAMPLRITIQYLQEVRVDVWRLHPDCLFDYTWPYLDLVVVRVDP